MKERNNYMLCCDCGYAVKEKTMFKKAYKDTAICLCRKCALKLGREIADTVENQMLNELKSAHPTEKGGAE